MPLCFLPGVLQADNFGVTVASISSCWTKQDQAHKSERSRRSNTVKALMIPFVQFLY